MRVRGVGIGEVVSHPNRLRGLGSVVSSPSGVRGAAAAAKAFLAYLRSTEHFWWREQSQQSRLFRKKSTLSTIGGTWLPGFPLWHPWGGSGEGGINDGLSLSLIFYTCQLQPDSFNYNILVHTKVSKQVSK